MRKLTAAILLASTLALAASGISLNLADRFEFTNCAAGGSAAQTLTAGGSYLFRVSGDADVFVCLAETGSTCAAGGELFPSGSMFLWTVTGNQKSVSCRSGGTGDAIFTRAP